MGDESYNEVKINGNDVDSVDKPTHSSEEMTLLSNEEMTLLSNEEMTLPAVLHRMTTSILFPDADASASLLDRVKDSVSENGSRLREASTETGRKVLAWTRRGSGLRALLVVGVGAISLVAMTGLLAFMLFFLAATVNAVVISLLISLAAAGGFLAIFFACLTAIYIGALSVAAFAISTATVLAILAVLIVSGWIGFFWAMWLALSKSLGFAKQSLSVTGSAISAYSGRHAHS